MYSPRRWPGAGWWSLAGEPASLWVAPRGGGLLRRAPGSMGLAPIPVRLRPLGFYPHRPHRAAPNKNLKTITQEQNRSQQRREIAEGLAKGLAKGLARED